MNRSHHQQLCNPLLSLGHSYSSWHHHRPLPPERLWPRPSMAAWPGQPGSPRAEVGTPMGALRPLGTPCRCRPLLAKAGRPQACPRRPSGCCCHGRATKGHLGLSWAAPSPSSAAMGPLLPWPHHLRPPRAEPSYPMDVRGRPGAPRHFPNAGDDLTGQKSADRRSSSASSVLIGVEDLAFK